MPSLLCSSFSFLLKFCSWFISIMSVWVGRFLSSSLCLFILLNVYYSSSIFLPYIFCKYKNIHPHPDSCSLVGVPLSCSSFVPVWVFWNSAVLLAFGRHRSPRDVNSWIWVVTMSFLSGVKTLPLHLGFLW